MASCPKFMATAAAEREGAGGAEWAEWGGVTVACVVWGTC
jgi:hypothetical protein